MSLDSAKLAVNINHRGSPGHLGNICWGVLLGASQFFLDMEPFKVYTQNSGQRWSEVVARRTAELCEGGWVALSTNSKQSKFCCVEIEEMLQVLWQSITGTSGNQQRFFFIAKVTRNQPEDGRAGWNDLCRARW